MRADEIATNGIFVKICGITSVEDALLAVAMGADALGFIFASGSTRQVTVDQVEDIVKRVPPDITTLGVFRNESPDRVVDMVLRSGLTGAQLHGRETPEQCREVAAKLKLVVQAFPAGDRALDRTPQYPVEIVLLDNPAPGSGEVFDWSMADGLPDGKRLLLAGGLNPKNVADAIRAVAPWGVDVSTGVEASPGVKDATKVREFIRNARNAYELLPKKPNRANPANHGSPANHPNRSNKEGALRTNAGPYDWQEEL
jgi:phosphoribosylanthranilate isomerase